MGSTVRARTQGVAELSRDLKALGDDLDKPIRDTLLDHAEKIADIGRGFVRHAQPSWPTSSAARLYGSGTGILASYYDAEVSTLSATIGSRHPGAPVWEWGGEIHPAAGSAKHAAIRATRGPARAQVAAGHQVIVIPRLQPINRAAEEDLPAFEQALDDAVDRLITEYGF